MFCSGIAGNGVVHCALGDLRLTDPAASGPVDVMIRPEQIKIIPAPVQGSVQAVIKNLVFYGHDAVVRLAVHDAAPGQDVTARVFSHAVPKPGSDVWLTVEGAVVAYAPKPTAPSFPRKRESSFTTL